MSAPPSLSSEAHSDPVSQADRLSRKASREHVGVRRQGDGELTTGVMEGPTGRSGKSQYPPRPLL